MAILLIAASLQMGNAYLCGFLGVLAHSWVGTSFIVIGAAGWMVRRWRESPPGQKNEFVSAWAWPLPWLLLGVLAWQIAAFPPTMNDSLCYRLPRIFVWLQENSISSPDSPDNRMMEMPWGWELLALPLVAINAVKFVTLLNLGAWVVFFILTHHWAVSAGATTWKARWLSVAMSAAPFCLLQAASSANDLFAAVLLMVSVHFLVRFGKAPHSRRIFLSLLAFMMACGIKSHFLVLGAGWGIWWLFDRSMPWRHTKMVPLLLFGPLAVLVSPVPVFISNYLAAGSFLGSGMAPGLGGGNPAFKMTAASIQFLTAQLQVPVMPGAERISLALQSLEPIQALQRHAPNFQPGVGVIPIIDAAGFGLIHFGMIVLGIIVGWRTADQRLRWLMAFAVAGFLAAGSQVVPTTIGRSFFGFGAMLVLPAITGLIQLRGVWTGAIAALATACGVVTMVLNPARPAWPSRTVENFARESEKHALADKLGHYHDYQKRAATGLGFLAPVPPGKTVAVLVRGGTPLVSLWTPDWHCHRIEFVHHLSPAEFEAKRHEWLLIGENARETFAGQVDSYRDLPGWEVVREESYLPILSREPERWTLHRRTNQKP